MATEDVCDWNEPLPSSVSEEVEEEEEEEDLPTAVEMRLRQENLEKLRCYVEQLAYRPNPNVYAKPRTEQLAKPRPRTVRDTLESFGDVVPIERKRRYERLNEQFITTEQLEEIINVGKAKERRMAKLEKRKQEVYYDMLTKMERQIRIQYLNVLVKKFGTFISKLATCMHIPPQLVEPYARMQRGIFCNILQAINVQPKSSAVLYYNTPEARSFEVCHKLAHALLSLIIKGLDCAATKNPDEIPPLRTNFAVDTYLRDRLMCAVAKKLRKPEPPTREELLYKCRPCKDSVIPKNQEICSGNLFQFHRGKLQQQVRRDDQHFPYDCNPCKYKAQLRDVVASTSLFPPKRTRRGMRRVVPPPPAYECHLCKESEREPKTCRGKKKKPCKETTKKVCRPFKLK